MRPKVAVFDLTCCEGCELQVLNCEEELPDLVRMLDIVEFREAKTERAEHYDIAFIDGACSRRSELASLKEIRRRSKMVIPLGSCAHLGNVNCLKTNTHGGAGRRGVRAGRAGRHDTRPAHKRRNTGRLLYPRLPHRQGRVPARRAGAPGRPHALPAEQPRLRGVQGRRERLRLRPGAHVPRARNKGRLRCDVRHCRGSLLGLPRLYRRPEHRRRRS